jgi:MerR family transcriptional regulator, heat shock protein HspR
MGKNDSMGYQCNDISDEEKKSEKFLEPVYTIGIAAKKLGVSVHSLRLYESEGLLRPFKTETGRRLYSDLEIEKVLCIRQMIQEDGLNFEGIRRLLALVPCWKIRDCDASTEKRCNAFENRKKPCWATEEKCLHPLEHCRDCDVYQKLVNCNDIHRYIYQSY